MSVKTSPTQFLFLAMICLFSNLANANSRALVALETEIFAPGKYPIPQFRVDPSWPELPNNALLGQVSGLAVDKDDNVWLLQRPNSLSRLDLALEQQPPTGSCCKSMPHVLKFSPQGQLLTQWGGPSIAPTLNGVNQWPANVHGLFVDDQDTVWLAGNGDDDHVVLNFSAEGKFIQQFGQRGITSGNESQSYLGNPADIFHNAKTGGLVIADGYINRRLVEFDSQARRFEKAWGAYARSPTGPTRSGTFDQAQASTPSRSNPDSEIFGDILHCLNATGDGTVYVCDRRNNRVQIFRNSLGGGVAYVGNLAVAGSTKGLGSATDVAFSPDEKYLYVADMMNGRIWIYWRETLELLAAIGRPGRYAGEFTWLHSIDTDSQGNLYTSEVNTGRRAQKLTLTGYKN